MIDSTFLTLLKTALSEGSVLEAPRIEAVVPVIRSGDQMIFHSPGKCHLSKSQKRRLRKRFDEGSVCHGDDACEDNDEDSCGDVAQSVLLGEVVVEFGFDATDEKDLQDFASCYEDYLLLVLRPTGIRYRGLYAVFSSSEKTAGKYRTIWSFRGSHAIDSMTAAADPAPELGVSELGAITKRLRALADNRPGSGRSQNWYQPAWGFSR